MAYFEMDRKPQNGGLAGASEECRPVVAGSRFGIPSGTEFLGRITALQVG